MPDSFRHKHIYRPDIDGLRALAILPVLFFHAGIDVVAGGYVGVDVFFVISGYLITRIIYGEIDSGTFSIIRFYERRARRILPALFGVCTFTTAMAWWLFVPADFQDYASSLAATMLFASNIVFMGETGYFAQPSEIKPLLHTWSLAVEEQYYIVFPLFLALIARGFRQYLAMFVLTVLAVSLIACIWLTGSHPVQAFYLLPTRGWELLVGSVLALPILPAIENRKILNIVSFTGLVLVLWGVFVFDADTAFPGWNTLFPCVGTAFLIYANGQGETAIGKLLGLKPFVWIGLISYSLYLWHWPLIVFAKYYAGGTLAPAALYSVIALSFAAAVISWRFIEQPFRRKTGRLAKFNTFAPICLAGGVILSSIGITGITSEGFPGRWSRDVLQIAEMRYDRNPDSERCHGRDPQELAKNLPCGLGPAGNSRVRFMIWGDSHADALMPAFKSLAETFQVGGWYASYGGCPPLATVYRLDRSARHQCRQFNDTVMQLLSDGEIQLVFLISRWAVYSDGNSFDGLKSAKTTFIGSESHHTHSRDGSRMAFREGLDKTLDFLKDRGIQAVLLEQVPEHLFQVPTALARAQAIGQDPATLGLKHQVHLARQDFVVSQFDALDAHYELTRIDPASRLCQEELCLMSHGGTVLYSDSHHLSRAGALWISGLFALVFEAMATNQ